MTVKVQSTLDKVVSFLKLHPDIVHALPSSESFTAFKGQTAFRNPSIPAAIVRPRTADEVSLLVRHFGEQCIPFVVRAGGNNLFGKSMVDGAVTIDLREINYCRVHASKKEASIGGGILMRDLIATLEQENLSTATGMVPYLGFAGWALCGGYGPFVRNFGFGFEQIVAAKIVNWRGEIVQADDDLLKGIRGAGGSFGVIVDLTIRTYPLKQLLSGHIVYDKTDTRATVKRLCKAIQVLHKQGWPRPLSIAPLFFNTPHGLEIAFHVLWSGADLENGAVWVDKIHKFAKAQHNGVRTTTHTGATQDFVDDFAPMDAYGSVDTISVRELTDEVIEIFAKFVETMPRQFGSGLFIHIASGPSEETIKSSVFGAHGDHYMLEFVYGSLSEEGAEESKRWAKSLRAEVERTNPQNILAATHVSHTPPHGNTLRSIYGSNYDFVLSLKAKYDPEGVFDLAVPFATCDRR